MRALIVASERRVVSGQPDCLTPIAGKPLIQRQIAALRSGGATEIGVVRGYQGEMINLPDVTLFEHPRWAETGTVAALATASDWLRSSPVVVSASNVFYRHELVHQIGSVRGSLVVGFDRRWRSVWDKRFADPLQHAVSFRRSGAGTLQAIGGAVAAADVVDGQPCGLFKFTPSAWQAAEAASAALDQRRQDGLTIIGLVQLLLAAKSLSIGTVGTDGQCGVIESIADVALYERLAADGDLQLEG